MSRNAYMLNEDTKNRYDWWWHSFVAVDKETGEKVPCFIEYYVINPGISSSIALEPKPSYAMIKAGCWGADKKQFNKLYPINLFHASYEKMDVQISDNIANEQHLSGHFIIEDIEHPTLKGDTGSMSWSIDVLKKDTYSVGYGASKPFRKLKLFEMFWHVQGMKVQYKGEVVINGRELSVDTEGGYQDKNWGYDYTNPWIWLNCNHLYENDILVDASLDIGGGNPTVLKVPLGPKILVAFKYKGTLYEFNFSKLFYQKQKWACRVDDTYVYWHLIVSNKNHILEVDFKCLKSNMLLVSYENPKGFMEHDKLFNGGHAFGKVILRDKKNRVITELTGEYGGCEYGQF